jgi:hypothetical protein
MDNFLDYSILERSDIQNKDKNAKKMWKDSWFIYLLNNFIY